MAGKRRRARTPKKQPLASRLLRGLFRLFLVGLVAAMLTGLFLFWYFGRDLPDIRTIDDYHPKQVTRVYSADGALIDLWVDEEAIYRTVVGLDAIPEVMRQAILAAEDADFYSHGGLDYTGLLRAIYTNLRTGSLSQGASTITQQVVKNLLLTPERSIRRKVQEAWLTFRLEDRLTKDEILAIYLNEVYFGANRYGVEEAAQYYFGKSVSQISLDEAALLAGLLQSPARYNPFRHPEAALSRRAYVLRQMRDKGFIEENSYRNALDAPLDLADNAHPHLDAAPYFTDTVRSLLFRQLGRERTSTGGLVVTTTLRLDHQHAAQQAVRAGLIEYDERHRSFRPLRRLAEDRIEPFRREHAPVGGLVAGETIQVVVLEVGQETLSVGLGPRDLPLPLEPFDRINPRGLPLEELYARGDILSVRPGADASPAQLAEEPAAAQLRFDDSAQAALVAMDPQTRQVLAMVGGYDHRQSPFNRATQARRASGSAFKPFIYGAALNARLVTPATLVRDEPTPFRLPGNRIWNPQNSDGEYMGPLLLRDALAHSRNVVSVRLLEQVGIEQATAFARSVGIEGPLVDNLTMALGGSEIPLLELANAYSTIASGGLVNPPILVTRVTDHAGNLVFSQEYQPQRGIDQSLAYLITDLMTSVIERGTGRRAQALGRPAAGKTGTTNEARDALFFGFVPQLLAGVWVGFDDYRPMGRGEYGGRAALPIWLTYMSEALEGAPVMPFTPPDTGIVRRLIDPSSGLLAQPDASDAIRELFLAGTEPARYAADSPHSSGRLTAPSSTDEHGGTGGAEIYDDF
ncbi:MAG: PBP1A family penicillin-binding protein [Bradymonadales bacterium]|nr:PBP1A family penicillin-binding protein [Bradymonadales bacterium]